MFSARHIQAALHVYSASFCPLVYQTFLAAILMGPCELPLSLAAELSILNFRRFCFRTTKEMVSSGEMKAEF